MRAKIADYPQLVATKRSEFITLIQQHIFKGMDKLVQKHGLIRFNAFEDEFEVAGGFKVYEASIS